MVKWSNPGKGVMPSPTPQCSSYWKGSLRVTLDLGCQLYLLTVANFQNKGKIWISCVNKALLSDGEKILFKQSNSFSVIRTLFHQKQWLRGSILTLNTVVQTQMMLNSLVAQIQQFSLKMLKKLHKLVLADCKLKLCEIAEGLKITEGSLFTILHEYLSMRKHCSKWLLHLLTVDQKQQQVDDSEHCFNTTKRSFCIKCDNRSNMEPLHARVSGSQLSGPQQVKAVQRCKHQRARFWCLYFGMRKIYCSLITFNREYYIALLVRLKEEIAKTWPQIKKKKVLFHQGNAPCHKSIATMEKLHELHFKLLPHLPYSPDLALG